MKRAEIYGGVTIDLHDGPIHTAYSRDINGKPIAQLIIGEAGQSIGISVSQSGLDAISQLEAAVAELKTWRQQQDKLRGLPEVA